MVRQGERVRVIAIHGGRGFRARLAAMGVLPGAVIEVVSNRGQGPILLAIMEGRMSLGRGMAQKILVE